MTVEVFQSLIFELIWLSKKKAILLTLALGRQRQADLCDFQVRLAYMVSLCPARTTQ